MGACKGRLEWALGIAPGWAAQRSGRQPGLGLSTPPLTRITGRFTAQSGGGAAVRADRAGRATGGCCVLVGACRAEA